MTLLIMVLVLRLVMSALLMSLSILVLQSAMTVSRSLHYLKSLLLQSLKNLRSLKVDGSHVTRV
jgi:hypothetical protein